MCSGVSQSSCLRWAERFSSVVGLTVQVVNTDLFHVFWLFKTFSILGTTACDLPRSCISSKLAAYRALPASNRSIDSWLWTVLGPLPAWTLQMFKWVLTEMLRGIIFHLFLVAHFFGTTVCVSKTLNVPGSGIGSARNVWPQPAHHPHPVHCTLTAGHHLQAAAQETNING